MIESLEAVGSVRVGDRHRNFEYGEVAECFAWVREGGQEGERFGRIGSL